MIVDSEQRLEREQRLIGLLAEALGREPEKRRAFLEQACAGDTELLEEVWTCVDREDRLGDFLERPAVVTPAAAAEATRAEGKRSAGRRRLDDRTDREPTFVGPYRILELLGEGGMGRVYLAEQTAPVRRRVALKVVRSSLEGPEATARFVAERQALARLSHPNVGQMLEAGTTDEGHPFFVMELVEGVPITRYCDREQLPVDARLELFVAVCRGVEHAHQKQILHRDLKPTNILVIRVDGRPVPKIIDFGISKALDGLGTEASYTTGDGWVGTPAYMSPEALETSEEPDTRTDVYALGVLLYELLTGSRPYESRDAGLAVELRRIAEEEVTRPSVRFADDDGVRRRRVARRRRTTERALRRRLTGDLDAVVTKALARDRQERYGTAAELAADVERHLRHEPTVAHAKGLGYLAAKFARRHRAFVAGAALVAAAMVLGVIGTSLGMLRAEREAAAARQAHEAEVVDFLVELAEEQRPLEEVRLAFERALAIREQTLGPQHPDVGWSALRLGTVLWRLGEHERGGAMARRGLAILEATLPAGGEDLEEARRIYAELGS